MNSLIGHPIPSGQSCNHEHTSNTKQTEKFICIYLCIYNNKKEYEVMNLKGHDKSWREGREGEIMKFYFNFLKIKKWKYIFILYSMLF